MIYDLCIQNLWLHFKTFNIQIIFQITNLSNHHVTKIPLEPYSPANIRSIHAISEVDIEQNSRFVFYFNIARFLSHCDVEEQKVACFHEDTSHKDTVVSSELLLISRLSRAWTEFMKSQSLQQPCICIKAHLYTVTNLISHS